MSGITHGGKLLLCGCSCTWTGDCTRKATGESSTLEFANTVVDATIMSISKRIASVPSVIAQRNKVKMYRRQCVLTECRCGVCEEVEAGLSPLLGAERRSSEPAGEQQLLIAKQHLIKYLHILNTKFCCLNRSVVTHL
jgi:hypothetical protein